jgi:uncharacterized membrane protein YjjP (DUF1212 family)
MERAPPMIDVDSQLDTLVQAGLLLLESGAATYRVEETLHVMSRAFGLAEFEVVIFPTGFTLTVHGPHHSLTRVCRVRRLGVNMSRVSAINSLSREAAAGSISPAQVSAHLERIRRERSHYPTWLVVTGVAVACGAFAALLGGGWRELAATVFGAALAMLARVALRKAALLPLVVVVIAAFLATAATSLGCRALRCPSPDLAPVAAVLQLVPGVPMVTAVIDLATGDILSGVVRGVYAAVIAAGIALGMLLYLAWGF